MSADMPNVALTLSTSNTLAMRRAAAIPIVFIGAAVPVGSGLVASLARPGGNVTGFANFGASVMGKWVELLALTVPNASVTAPAMGILAP